MTQCRPLVEILAETPDFSFYLFLLVSVCLGYEKMSTIQDKYGQTMLFLVLSLHDLHFQRSAILT